MFKKRGNPNFNDLEKELEYVKNIDEKKIRLCMDVTCGNKAMCFEYEGKIWKEGRKSMNYNRDYCVVDDCKSLFGLEKINMKRVCSDFYIEKIDKSIKSWENNWRKVIIGKDDEYIVYCVMDKVCPGDRLGKNKNVLLRNRDILKEYVKIGVYRGIFRVSDFNCNNVLIRNDGKLVSIDESDIGKRVSILGKKDKWLINELNKDKSIINEIMIDICKYFDENFISMKMKEYKYNDLMIMEVLNNFKILKEDLELEGVEF